MDYVTLFGEEAGDEFRCGDIASSVILTPQSHLRFGEPIWIYFHSLGAEWKVTMRLMELWRVLKIDLEDVTSIVFVADGESIQDLSAFSLVYPLEIVEGERLTHGPSVQVVGVPVSNVSRRFRWIIIWHSFEVGLGLASYDTGEASSDC